MKMVLLGDSVFDNARYVQDGSVEARLAQRVESVFNLSQDGAVVDDVAEQMARLATTNRGFWKPGDHVFVSVGGNDALQLRHMTEQRVKSLGAALAVFGVEVTKFEERYFEMLAPIAAWGERAGVPVTLCTIYTGWADYPGERDMMTAAVRMFNDAIIRVAAYYALPVLDLRDIVNEADDFCFSVEPSDVGGQKIVDALVGYATVVSEERHAIA